MAAMKVLNLNKEFRRVYGRGKSYVHPALVVYVLRNGAGFCRVGITVSKKVGCAVVRNRARRVIQEALRQTYPAIHGGWDIVCVARGRTPGKKSTEITAVLTALLQKAGLLRETKGVRSKVP